MDNNHIWQILAWFLAFLIVTLVGVVSFFWKNFVKRMEANFDELFQAIKYMATMSRVESLEKEVRDAHDRLVRLESKVENCKNCNQ